MYLAWYQLNCKAKMWWKLQQGHDEGQVQPRVNALSFSYSQHAY